METVTVPAIRVGYTREQFISSPIDGTGYIDYLGTVRHSRIQYL
jgi:hypothetical protein